MIPRNKINKMYSVSMLYLLANLLLGIAIIADMLFLGLLSLGLLYIWFSQYISGPLSRRRVAVLYGGTVLYMMTIMSWYRNIDARGWGDIAGLDPSIVLMFAVLVASMFCAALTTGFWIAIHFLLPNKVVVFRWLLPILWAGVYVIYELIISTGFSLFVNHSDAPIEPTWNIFSSALLTPSTPLIFIGKLLGFWGTTWALCLVIAGVISVVRYRKELRWTYSAPFILLLVAALGMSALAKPATDTNQLEVVAVANEGDTDYLRSLPSKVPGTNNPAIIVLPEYSTLLHPRSGQPFSVAYDARDDFLQAFANEDVYIVGTETEQHDNKNYVETYVVNESQQKVKRQVKTFLIPGGEYAVPWIAAVLSRFDESSVTGFDALHGRVVIDKKLAVDELDPIAPKIGAGACSTLMLPYHFRNEVQNGAMLLTSNVSYEQFRHAPEYERFATRLAKFHASSLNRWMILGANFGTAAILSPSGKVVASAINTDTAATTITASNSITPYAKLGDTFIIMVTVILSLASILAIRIFEKLPLRLELVVRRMTLRFKKL